MASQRFLGGFVAIFSDEQVSFAESESSPPLWLIDTNLFAGQPLLSVGTTPKFRESTTTIVLSGALYPGTNLPADLSIEITESPGDEIQGPSQEGTLALAFGNASFGWGFTPIDTDPQTLINPFLEWLKGRTTLTARIALGGTVAAFANGGGIDFGPATAATLQVTPGILTIEDAEVCTVNIAGIAFTGTSLSLEALDSDPPDTKLVVQATSPLSIPLPAPTPVGNLTVQSGFSTFTVSTSETNQSAIFSSNSLATQYTLELLGGVTDLDGAPVRFDLAGGELTVDLSSTSPIFLVTSGRPSSVLLLTAGIGLSIPQPADGPGTLSLAMSFDGSAWHVLKAALPLPGLFLPLDDGIAEPGSPREARFSLVPAGPNWIQLGPLPDGQPRLHIEDFGVHVIRPADLLDIEISCTNVAFEVVDGSTPTLGPAPNGQPSFWRAVFPPQHMAEQAFYRGSEQTRLALRGDDFLPRPPVAVLMAGASQLAFFMPADVPRFEVTLANLLDWKRYKQAGTSLDTFDVPYDPPAPLQPPDPVRQTAIELPYGLFLSLDEAAGWSHSTTVATDLSELWHTRLAFRKPLGPDQFVIDERPSSALRQGRAFWSPDFSTPRPDLFKSSLTAGDRQQIVHLTSTTDPSAPTFDPSAHTFDVNELMLTALGATVHINTSWNPPPDPNLDLTLWQHLTSYGRDQYVRVGRRGFVFPYGHRATQITVSERRFLPPSGNGEQAVAYLVQFDYIIITQPVRLYAGRDLPFTGIEFVTRITPTLNQPQPLPGANAFWIFANNVPFLFDLLKVDLRGRRVCSRAPAIFVEADQDFDTSVDAAAAEYRQNSSINTPVDFGRQKIAFAPSEDPENTSFETATLSLDVADLRPAGQRSWKDDEGNPLFRPSMKEASIHHTAAVALAGAPETVRVNYFSQYLKQARVNSAAAANSAVDVFLEFSDRPPPAAKLGADKTGVAAPAYAMTAISQTFGAVGGDPQNILNGIFKPDEFLDPDAKFLGDIDLRKLIPLTTGQIPIPNLHTVINTAQDGTPISAVTTFDWHPPLVQNPFIPGLLSLTFDPDATLDLTAKVTTQLSTPPTPPTSELRGQVGRFSLEFAGIVRLNFESMTFESVTGKKPKIDVQLKKPLPVEFLGELAFVNALRDLIPSNGFSPPSVVPSAALTADDVPATASGPFLDVTATAIVAGFALAVPSVGVGVFSLENIRLGAALTLPLENKPVSFEFNFGELDHKFLLTVDLLAGGGYLVINLDSSGIRRLEFAIEFGANVALNLFVASGSVHVLAGAFLTFGSNNNQFTGYLRAGGELTVLGLVSVSVDFYLGLSYREDTGDLYGKASLSVEVSVGFISKSVTLTLERRFPGSGIIDSAGKLVAAGLLASDETGAPSLEDILTEPEWSTYAGAFA